MTRLLYAQISHPFDANSLSDPARVIGMSLLTVTLELGAEAEKKGLTVDWSSFEVETNVDVFESRSLVGVGDENIEIRTHRVQVRAHGAEGTDG